MISKPKTKTAVNNWKRNNLNQNYILVIIEMLYLLGNLNKVLEINYINILICAAQTYIELMDIYSVVFTELNRLK